MMEDPLTEKYNGLNDISDDDGGSFDIEEGGSFDLDETEDEGSVGTNGFITPLAQYKPHDDHLGLRWRRRANVSYSEDDHFPDDDSEDEEYSADDGGSFDIDETEDQGSDAFTTTLAQYKPHNVHPGLRQRKRNNESYSEETHIQNDDHRRRDHRKVMHLTRTPQPTFHLICNVLKYISLGGPTVVQVSLIVKKTEPHLLYKPRDGHFGSRWRRINLSSLGETQINLSSWVRDVVSKTISPRRTAIAAAGTEQKSLGGNSSDERKGWSKMDFGWIFAITNIVLESMSAIFTQLASTQKPQYELFGMLLSYLALLTCIIELIYEGRRPHQHIPIGS